MQMDPSPIAGRRGETPVDERESQANTPPRAEHNLTPMNRSGGKGASLNGNTNPGSYTTKLPQI